MNLQEIKELIKTVDKSGINSLSLKSDGFSLKIDKSATIIQAQPQTKVQETLTQATQTSQLPQTQETKEATTQTVAGEVITSPMVGTFYQAPSPDSPPYVKVGDTVNQGQTLAIIEAMKIMNELEAEFSCKILEILVKDGEVVEYDTPLFRVEKV